MTALADQVRALLGVGLDELRGARAAGEIPVPTAVVNRLIASRLAVSSAPVKAVHVEPRPGNVVDVQVTPSARFVPTVTIEARIERQPEFPASPVFVLRWRIPAAGPLARLAAPFIGNLKSLPPGVRIDGDIVVIDLRDILGAQGQLQALEYVRTLRVDTRPGGFLVSFEVGVDATATR